FAQAASDPDPGGTVPRYWSRTVPMSGAVSVPCEGVAAWAMEPASWGPVIAATTSAMAMPAVTFERMSPPAGKVWGGVPVALTVYASARARVRELAAQWSLRPVKLNIASLRVGTLEAEKKNSLVISVSLLTSCAPDRASRIDCVKRKFFTGYLISPPSTSHVPSRVIPVITDCVGWTMFE